MKTVFTLIRKHGQRHFQIAVGSDAQMRDHRKFFKSLRMSRSHPDIAEAVVCLTTRRVRLDQAPGARVEAPKQAEKSTLRKIVDVVTRAEPKQKVPVRKAKSFNTPAAAKGAFAQRVAATIPAGAPHQQQTPQTQQPRA